MSHITAGDISPIRYKPESTYNHATGNAQYYGDITEGGAITPTDNPNPYVTWTGSKGRKYDPSKYVYTNLEAGYNASLETRDLAGWDRIIDNALMASGYPSRQTILEVMHNSLTSSVDRLTYSGCMTDRLEIRADQPGGIVRFEETVVASYSTSDLNTTPVTHSTHADKPAVQWKGPTYYNGVAIYPQSLRISINNNIGRVKGEVNPDGTLRTISATTALVLGRQEITAEVDVWMEDLAAIIERGPGFLWEENGGTTPLVVTFGIENPVALTMTVQPLADGQHHGIVQDKQMQTLRFKCSAISKAAVTSS
jgi:hypothetical protein